MFIYMLATKMTFEISRGHVPSRLVSVIVLLSSLERGTDSGPRNLLIY